MSHSGVEFDRPPVVETVLGVQFSPLAGLTAAHLGWFWKQFLGPEWDSASNATPILDQGCVLRFSHVPASGAA